MVLLEVRNVVKSFGGLRALQDVSLSVAKGEIRAVIGPNGAGKSTFFNVMTGLLKPDAGDVVFEGKPITGLPPHRIIRKGIGRSFQITNIFHNLSVFENLRCAVLWSLGYRYSFWHRLAGLEDARRRADEVLDAIGLASRRERPAGLLAYAEQRALEIGITIAGGADVILLDEPTAGMSRSETDHVVELVRRVTTGKTLVMVEHDMGVVFNLADRISVLVYGEVLASGTPEEIRANAAVQEAYLGVIHKDGSHAEGSHA